MTEYITYEQVKEFYAEFKQNPPKDDFEALVEELKYLSNLMKLAYSENKKEEGENYKKLRNEVVKKLTDLGYKVKTD